MKNQRKIKQKIGRKQLLQLNNKIEGVLNYLQSNTLEELLQFFEVELKKRYNVIESQIFISNDTYKNFLPKNILETKVLKEEIDYLYQESIINWVLETNKPQIIPSPFANYGTLSLIILPLIYNGEKIGCIINLSKYNRLQFNEIQIESLNYHNSLFVIKFISLVNEYNLLKQNENINHLEKLILKNINSINEIHFNNKINRKVFLKIDSILNQLNLLDKDDLFDVRTENIKKSVIEIKNQISQSQNLKITGKFNLYQTIQEIFEILDFENSLTEVIYQISVNQNLVIDKISLEKFKTVLMNIFSYILNLEWQNKNHLNIYSKYNSLNGLKLSFCLSYENIEFLPNEFEIKQTTKLRLPNQLEIARIISNDINLQVQMETLEESFLIINLIIPNEYIV